MADEGEDVAAGGEPKSDVTRDVRVLRRPPCLHCTILDLD